MSGTDQKPRVAGEALLEALLEASVDGIIIIDRQGVVLAYNPGAQRMFGYPPHEVVGQKVNMLMASKDRRHHDEYIQRYQQTGEPRIIGIGREVLGQHQSGEVFPLDLAVGEAPKQGLFIGILRDLRQREHLKRMLDGERQQVRDLEQSLAHVHRVSMLGEMAAGIAHEINQPLAAISTYADAGRRLLAQAEPVEEKLSYALDQIGGQARRAGEVVRRMRSMATQGSVARQSVSVNELVQDLLELARLEARELNAPIHLHLSENLSDVLADPVQIQQVLLNLIRNGLEAMVKRSQAELGLTISTEAPNPQIVQVTVADRGMGVASGQSEAIFEAFHTSKPTGMGMGLSICRGIIQRHEGRLWHEDDPAGGSRFIFTLPVARPNDEAEENR